MTSKRIEEIQKKTAHPDSLSVQQALLQVWNECEREPEIDKQISQAIEIATQEIKKHIEDAVKSIEPKLEEESDWISVIDKMPERHLEFHRSILITCKTDSHEIMEDAFTDNNDFYGNDGFLINNVTHWKYRNN